MNLSFLKSPEKLPKETVVKILFISIAIILFTIIFTPKNQYTLQNQAGIPAIGSMARIFPSVAIAPQDAYRTGGYAKMVMGDATVDESVSIMPPEYGGGAGSPTFPTERKVIRNGSLDLVVENVQKSVQDVTGVAERLEGWVENQNLYEYSAGMQQGSLTIRVPEAKFSEAMRQIALLAVRVQNEQVNSSDVSAQVVDLESRLKNEKVKEAQYILILKDAKKVSDILEVTNMLSSVRGTIEQIEGQINYLARQTSMSTITVSLTPVANAKEVTNEWKPGLVAKEAFRNLIAGLTGLLSGIIVFVIQVLPILILYILFFAFIIFVLWKIGGALIKRIIQQ